MTTCSLSFPPQINLARLPTPVQPLRRLSEKYGVELYIKRDALDFFFLPQMLRVIEFQQIVFVKSFFADGIDNQPATGSQRLQSVYYRFPGRDGVDDAAESF